MVVGGEGLGEGRGRGRGRIAIGIGGVGGVEEGEGVGVGVGVWVGIRSAVGVGAVGGEGESRIGIGVGAGVGVQVGLGLGLGLGLGIGEFCGRGEGGGRDRYHRASVTKVLYPCFGCMVELPCLVASSSKQHQQVCSGCCRHPTQPKMTTKHSDPPFGTPVFADDDSTLCTTFSVCFCLDRDNCGAQFLLMIEDP